MVGLGRPPLAGRGDGPQLLGMAPEVAALGQFGPQLARGGLRDIQRDPVRVHLADPFRYPLAVAVGLEGLAAQVVIRRPS